MDCNNNMSCKNKKLVKEAMKLAEKMLVMADHGATNCEDDKCLVIYGVIRDCGYSIRKTVEQEQFGEISECGHHPVLH